MIAFVVVCVWFSFCFFFQAEDGIRDLVRSRGLGDVYKRQGLLFVNTGGSPSATELWAIREGGVGDVTDTHVVWKMTKNAPHESSPVLVEDLLFTMGPVSYTHLTLPTIYSV